MRPSEIAIAPSVITRRGPSIVTIVPPRTSSSTCRRFCAATSDSGLASMVVRTIEISKRFRISNQLLLLQEARVEGARQQVGNMKLFTPPLEIREDDRRFARELPDDLPASSARRSQRL